MQLWKQRFYLVCMFSFINSSNAHLVFSKDKQGRRSKEKKEEDREIKEDMNSIPESTF